MSRHSLSITSQILAVLPVFDAAARHGSFTRAARELGITQGAVSRRIQNLEEQLGLVLFSRQQNTGAYAGRVVAEPEGKERLEAG